MASRASRGLASLAARLERAERMEELQRGPLTEDGRVEVDNSTYVLLMRLFELDPDLYVAYTRATYGHIRDPWREEGHPPPSPERVQEARNAYDELWREERCRRLAEETGDRLIWALWDVYARERDELRAGKYIHPACVRSDNLWLIRPESVEKSRPRDASRWLSPFERAVRDREMALREEGATPVEDPDEAGRLANEVAQKIVATHMLHGQYLCDRLGVPFDVPHDAAADEERR